MYAKYRIVKASNTDTLEENVNNMIGLLWEPIGGVVFDPLNNCYMQTMGVDQGNWNAHVHALQVRRVDPSML
jgi:hypothetical protein